MKKRVSVLMVVSAVCLLLVSTASVSAAVIDTHANIRADFYTHCPEAGCRNNPDAYGYAIINYVKGQDVWNVTGEVWNARADDYAMSVGTSGTCVGNAELAYFTVAGDGYGSFHAQVNNVPEAINIARIYKEGTACNTELVAGGEDRLVFRGSGRCKGDNGKWHD